MHLRQNYHFGRARIAMHLKRYYDVEISLVWGGEGPAPAGPRSPAGEPTLREAAPGPPGADRREVHRAHRRSHDQTAAASSPPSTTAPGCECSAPTQEPASAPHSRSSTTSPSGSRSPSRCSSPTKAPIPRTGFTWHVLDRGIGDVYIKPATPRFKGKVGRSHRTDDTDMFNSRLHAWGPPATSSDPTMALTASPYETLKEKANQP